MKTASMPELNIIKSSISAGAEKPFTLLHITDTHLTLADLRDGKRKTELAERRTQGFPDATEYLRAALEYARERNFKVLHTGDIIDFVSSANLEAVTALTNGTDLIMAAGNHEFSQYVGECEEDETYKLLSLARVQAHFNSNLRFDSIVLNGVNIVTLDNSYYNIRRQELDSFKKELQKGFPIILCVHTPFYEETLFRFMLEEKKEDCAYLVGCPQELMKDYTEHRFRQQLSDSVTSEFCELLNSEKAIKAVLAGHVHSNFKSRLKNGAVQLVTGLTCKGEIREISVC